MSDLTLGDRMKRYENVYRTYLPRRTYTLLRLDGRAFHTYTRGLDKPFDLGLMFDMDETAKALCREVTGTAFAYVQSDEISLLVTDFKKLESQPWMGGNISKILSLSAAQVSVTFNTLRQQRQVPGGTLDPRQALFDARVWTMSDPNEVGNYFIWRQRDAVKNSISMLAESHFSHRRLDRLNAGQRQDLLFKEAGVNWDSYPPGTKRGRVIVKETYTVEPDAVRTRWVTLTETPHFSLGPGSWLSEHIPQMPALASDVD